VHGISSGNLILSEILYGRLVQLLLSFSLCDAFSACPFPTLSPGIAGKLLWQRRSAIFFSPIHFPIHLPDKRGTVIVARVVGDPTT